MLGAFALAFGLLGSPRQASASAPASCSAILFGGGSVGDGIYTIDPAQNGSNVSVYCDMTTDGGGWTLAGYGANSNLGGSLTAANGAYNGAVRSGSANIASVALAQGSTKVALSWSNGAPTGNLGSYSEAVRWSIPNPAGQTLNPDGGGYNCVSAQWTSVSVVPIVGTPNLPASMYTRTTSLGASYGQAYGLVRSDGNPQCDWYIDGQGFRAVYLGINTGYEYKGVVYEPGGESNHATPNTMAIWFRSDAPPPPPVVVYTSDANVDTWDPIFPASADPSWPTNVCKPIPAVGLGAAWTNPHKASSFGTSAHPWQPGAGFTANWINAWGNLSSQGPSGHNWTKYSTHITGNGAFVLNLLADNCSWIYLDGILVGFQDASLSPRTYPVTLSGGHTLEFIIFDGGGLAGGMYRLETNTGTVVFPDTDHDGLTDPQEHLYGTDVNNPDTDGDGVSDGDEVAAGTNPLAPAVTPTTTTVTFGAGPFVYNGSPFTATASVSPAAAGAATITYSGDCTNAGSTCQATATFAATATYSGSTATANLTITKAPTTTSVSFGSPSVTYTGSAFTATASVSPAAAGAATIAYSGDCTNAGNTCQAVATYAESANYLGSSANASLTIDKAPTTTAVSFGAGPFVYTGAAFTATASVSPAAAGAATIAYSGDCTNGGITCTATATFAGSANYLGSNASANITIKYAICAARGDDDERDDHDGDRAKGHESGSTIPVKIRVCTAAGRNAGSRSLPVKAISLSPSGTLNDSGKANPGNLFRFDDGTYMFNLSTKGLAAGTYTLNYTVGNDPTVYQYSFTIRPEKDKKAEEKKDDKKGDEKKGDDKKGNGR